jgi:hypothetical protein
VLKRLLTALVLGSAKPREIEVEPPAPATWPLVMNSRNFWANYFMVEERNWPRDPGAEALEAAVTLPVSEGYSLALDVYNADVDLFLQPRSGARLKLGWNDSAHWHPDVFRWDETRSVCQHLSRLGAEYQHPGIPLLLLSLFTPATDEDDDAACYGEVCEALTVLQLFSTHELDMLARPALREHDEGAHWEQGSSGFVLIGDPPVYTLRSEGSDFPFGELKKMLVEAGA